MRWSYWVIAFWLVLSLETAPGMATSLLGQGGLQASRAPLFQSQSGPSQVAHAPNSLFAGQRKGSLFGPVPTRVSIDPVALLTAPSEQFQSSTRADLVGLRDFIAQAEAGPAGYNAVVWNAHIKPPKLPTRMTLAEINAWITATPGQNHAIGRYQFIPSTLRGLVERAGLPDDLVFTPEVQDFLANLLLKDAGIIAFQNGELPRVSFMNNLAKIWAGLPNSSGKSHYHGFAGNKATVSWSAFEAELLRLFPDKA